MNKTLILTALVSLLFFGSNAQEIDSSSYSFTVNRSIFNKGQFVVDVNTESTVGNRQIIIRKHGAKVNHRFGLDFGAFDINAPLSLLKTELGDFQNMKYDGEGFTTGLRYGVEGKKETSKVSFFYGADLLVGFTHMNYTLKGEQLSLHQDGLAIATSEVKDSNTELNMLDLGLELNSAIYYNITKGFAVGVYGSSGLKFSNISKGSTVSKFSGVPAIGAWGDEISRVLGISAKLRW